MTEPGANGPKQTALVTGASSHGIGRAIAERLLADGSPLVRAMAIWALGQLDPIGAQAAAQHYFGKRVADLRVAESPR